MTPPEPGGPDGGTWQVTGHSRVLTVIRHSLDSGRLSHAYLFTGPEHVGKSTLARNLAQAVNCEGQAPPCQECRACRRIAAGKHADIHMVDLLSGEKKEIGIRQIMDMQASAHLPPFEGRRKVFIFERADMMSHEAANSLLKTLEEPPPNVLILLLTARESALLPTIASRCQRLELRPLTVSAVRDFLVSRHGVEPGRADLLARLSGGSPGWAVLALQDPAILQERDQRMADFARLGTAPAAEKMAYAADLAALFGKGREKVNEILSAWAAWWRDVILIKSGNRGWICNTDQEEALARQASRVNALQVSSFVREIGETGRRLEQNANARLALEVLLLRMPQGKDRL